MRLVLSVFGLELRMSLAREDLEDEGPRAWTNGGGQFERGDGPPDPDAEVVGFGFGNSP